MNMSADQITHLGITIPWPFQSYMETAAIPAAVPSVRLHARRMLGEWGLNGQADAVELVVCELVTNAVRASGGIAHGVPAVRLWLSSDGDRVFIQVWDASEHLPVLRDRQPDAESGRGLLIVDSISEGWGSYCPARLSGKVVWAVVGGWPGE